MGAEVATMISWVARVPDEPEIEHDALNAAQRHEITAIFRLYDKDGSGKISRDEFLHALRHSGVSDEELEGYFDLADTDGDGGIDLEEWVMHMRDVYLQPPLTSTELGTGR